MKRWTVALVVSAVVGALVGLPALASTVAGNGHGPPPWSNAHEQHRPHGQHGKGRDAGEAGRHAAPGQAGKHDGPGERGPGAAWRELTPAQRARLMADLARQHADGMEAWADCVAAAREDCVKPLPPGHAKRG